jgi:Tfp pilus assembly protein PilF
MPVKRGGRCCWTACRTRKRNRKWPSRRWSFAARHNLANAYYDLGRSAEAEAHWKAALRERPSYEPAWRGLAVQYLAQTRWEDLKWLVQHLETQIPDKPAAICVRARACLVKKEFEASRRILEPAIRKSPRELELRVLWSHSLLQEGTDLCAAEMALRAVLEIDPAHAEARHNLAVLLHKRGPS